MDNDSGCEGNGAHSYWLLFDLILLIIVGANIKHLLESPFLAT